ncbi:dephospho-CoA kinase [Rubinisphaera italica]|uniref:Dephospho-CoA kinase n=1 Tax=Rubinisphaera italica TaxID=2527969 RepID=A0A5C5XGV7_9PLAN|nr:dephospho-CoA kinase [Rubinisphaera italica]TWT62317.1 Dephospho-CoA kinase [Rubinisphaera italica]
MPQTDSRFAVLGFAGGVGSGKSTLSRMLAEKLSIPRIDGDELGHQVLKLNTVRDQLTTIFGSEILNQQGEVDRPTLGKKVWGEDNTAIQNRKQLEIIVHPEIKNLMQQQIDSAREQGVRGVLLDAAVMLETGWGNVCDKIVFIETSQNQRLQNVTESRNWTLEQLQKREQSQWSLEDKKSHCDVTIDNSGPLNNSFQQLLNYVERTFGWL